MDSRNWKAETGARQASAQASKGGLRVSSFYFRISTFDFRPVKKRRDHHEYNDANNVAPG